MATFAVTAVQWADNEVSQVLLRDVGGDGTVFSTDPVASEVSVAVKRLRNGQNGVLVFPGGKPGPNIRIATLGAAREGIEGEISSVPNRTLRDMPTF